MTGQTKNKGWTVTFAGTGINLALGVLYAYSVFKAAIREHAHSWGWSEAQLNDPYAVACIVFAFVMIAAGRMQDRVGPRLTATLGGVFTGVGFLVAAFSTSLWAWILGFGVLAGAGIGLAYASATPPAVKWFPPNRMGLIAGLVVSGFGLASAYISPLASAMLSGLGVSKAMLVFGIAFFVVVVVLSQLLVDPPAGFNPLEAPSAEPGKRAAQGKEVSPKAMMRTPAFFVLWMIFFIGAGAGLMIIGNVAGMAKNSLGELAWVAVTVLAVGNAAGRILAGFLSDRIGRTKTMAIMLGFQAILMFSLLAVPKSSPVILLLMATFIGFNYGSNLSLFPSATKDFFGLKNFGVNYGIVFTAWGVGGFVLSRVSQMIKAHTGSYSYSYVVAGGLLILGLLLTFALRAMTKKNFVQIGGESIPAGGAAS